MATRLLDPAPGAALPSGGPPSAFMSEALRLAALGAGRTAPNPPVGAVVVKDGQIVGRGYHRRAGQPHAEAEALAEAGAAARGADLYVTLEPCPHHGRTPPCTEAVAAAGIARVVCAVIDPNPAVQGLGRARLERLGLEVQVGDGAAAAAELLRFYSHHVRTGLPYVVYKFAISLDGRVAAEGGAPFHLSGAKADAAVHALRDTLDVVMVGAGTVIADDPRLTTRRPDGAGRDAVRVVVDSHLRTPPGARLLGEGTSPVVIACRAPAPEARARRLADAGAEILALEDDLESGPGVPMAALLGTLGRRGLMSVLVEGGPTLAGTLARLDAIDEVQAFVAMRLLGGFDGPGALRGVGGVLDLALAPAGVRALGEDLLVVLRRVVREGETACSPASSKA
jgi:diaminohydroxyphosphoribosylaminopyrimidine deaminase / 5-amino-6-(5-phosphoribosylamino)uracil reductase